MKKVIVPFVLTAILLTICSVVLAEWTPEYREKVTTNTYQVSYDKMFNACMRAFEGHGYPIKQIDKSNGIIETGDKVMGNVFGGGSVKIYARLEKTDDNNTRVVLSLHRQVRVEFNSISRNPITYGDETIKEKDYKNVFSWIEAELAKSK